MKKIFGIYILTIFLCAPIIVVAQKLPGIQEKSLRAPVNVKIDGELGEWNYKFQAYNKATDIFYSISNDDNNLYLVVQAKDPIIIKKIITSGIVFKINNSAKKNEENYNFSFPCPLPLTARTRLLMDINKKIDITDDSILRKRRVDSLIIAMNTIVDKKFEKIKITGINSIKDTLISIHNETGVLAAAHFDNLRFYNYELAVPLKYITSEINKDSKISYKVEIEGIVTNRPNIVFIEESSDMRAMNYTTDFSGAYNLSKR